MSKLGPHLLPGGEGETLEWLKLVPTVAKFCYTFDAAQSANPATFCLGRPEENFIGGTVALGDGDPAVAARRMVKDVYAPLIAVYPAMDGWEGPNEIGIGVDQADLMRWYAAFLAELGKGIYQLGSRAVLGAWSVGAPELEMWRFYSPVLRACLPVARGGYNAILSRHSYGTLDQWCAYRHTLDEVEFQRQGFENTPLIISECGGDYIKNQAGDVVFKPWRKQFNNDLAAYWVKYLRPFIAELNKTPYVMGATLFTVGDGYAPAWHDFDVAAHDGPSITEVMRADPPDPPAATGPGNLGPYVSRGILGEAFTVEQAQVEPDAPLWFTFQVTNTSATVVEYAILAARTVEGQCAQSWTNQRLQPGQTLKWRDKIVLTEPGLYHLYLGIGYDDKEACVAMAAPWDRLSNDIAVKVAYDVVEEKTMATTTTENPEITVITTLAGDPATVNQVLPKVHQFHRDLGVGLAQPAPFTAVSRPAAAHWLITFTAPNAAKPTPIPVTWDISVRQTLTDAAGVVWLRVNPDGQPAMWILADQATVK